MRRGGWLHEQLIHITPCPVLSRLKAPNDWVCGIVEMSGGVFAYRLVAAPDVATREAKAEMNPVHSHLETFLAALWRARRNIANLVEVSAFNRHGQSPRVAVLLMMIIAGPDSSRRLPSAANE
jgi:hypothetical protein